MQRMEGSGVADRLALLAHHELVRWYEALGFVDKGESAVKFGGGNWREMVSLLFSNLPSVNNAREILGQWTVSS